MHLLHTRTHAYTFITPLHPPNSIRQRGIKRTYQTGKDINADILGFLKSLADFSRTMLLTDGFISDSLEESAYLKVFI